MEIANERSFNHETAVFYQQPNILAGYASNGDILLWELINEQKYGREIGHWESVEIVRKIRLNH